MFVTLAALYAGFEAGKAIATQEPIYILAATASLFYVYFAAIKYPQLSLAGLMVMNYSAALAEHTGIGMTRFILAPVIIGSLWSLARSKSYLTGPLDRYRLFHILFLIYITCNLFFNTGFTFSSGVLRLRDFLLFSLMPFYAAALLLDNERRLNTFIISYVGFLLITSIVSHFFLGGSHHVQTQLLVYGRFQLFGDAINYSIPFVSGIIMSFYLYLANDSKVTRIAAVTCLCYFIYIVILTGTRQSLMSSLLGILLIVWFSRSRFSPKGLKHGLFASLIYLLLLGGFVYFVITSIQTLALSNRYTMALYDPFGSLETRFNYYRQTLDVFFVSPLNGVGLGEFGRWNGSGDLTDHAHNLILEVLAEQGVVGFCLFIIILWFPLVRGLSYIYTSCQTAQNVLLTCMFVGLTISELVRSCFSGGIGDKTILWLALGVLWNLTREKSSKKSGRSTTNLITTELR